MVYSYNGWEANTSPDAIGIERMTVEGVSFPQGVRGGDVYTVFRWLAEQYHKRVEPLHDGWCWGYDYRQNRNANNLSCHSSGTAVDFNAPNHPNGSRGTFSSGQVAVIRELLGDLEGAVYWGGDFSGTADEMHFEINGSTGLVARVAQTIRNNARDGEFTVSPEDAETIAKMLRSIRDDIQKHVDEQIAVLAADVRSHPYWAAQLLANGDAEGNRRYPDAAKVDVFTVNNLAALQASIDGQAPVDGV